MFLKYSFARFDMETLVDNNVSGVEEDRRKVRPMIIVRGEGEKKEST